MILSFANHKGGVGKTTSVVSIGSCLASMGYNTLLIDLDSQANLTSILLPQITAERTLLDTLTEGTKLPIVKVRENLSVVPSGINLAEAELALQEERYKNFVLKKALDKVVDDYDFILLDCPPSLALLTTNALVATDFLFIPLTAEALPYKGLDTLIKVVGMIQERLNPELKLGGIFITRWAGRKLNKVVAEQLRETYKEKVLDNKVRENITIAEAPLSGTDVLTYAPDSNGATDYSELTREIVEKIGNISNTGNKKNR